MFNDKIIDRSLSSYFMAGLIATLLIFTMVASATLTGEAFAQASATAPSPSVTTGTFNPQPGYYQARLDPSFSIHIPFSDLGYAGYDPRSISIPAGMTVIWFNDDSGEHSVTTNTTSSNLTSGAKPFDSKLIAPGGFYTHRFTSPGTYDYYDTQNPAAKGRIKVGNEFEAGNNMDMLIGGNGLPFNSSKLARITLSFVPHATAAIIPPNLSLTFNVTIANSTKTLFKHQFEDSDGILDLELIPTIGRSNLTQQFVSWGPDLISSTGVAGHGAYHVQGPVLVNNTIYTVQVSIIERSRSLLSSPISDTFVLPPIKTP